MLEQLAALPALFDGIASFGDAVDAIFKSKPTETVAQVEQDFMLKLHRLYSLNIRAMNEANALEGARRNLEAQIEALQN